jgi:NAD(P) transhydrogenase subunit alpha
VVITTALVPGQRAPVLIEESAVRGMRPGSVIVDLAAEKGGNCACTEADRAVLAHGVRVLGPTNLPSDLATNASQLYARNLVTLLLHLLRDGRIALDLEDEITRGALLTHEGAIANEAVRARAGA